MHNSVVVNFDKRIIRSFPFQVKERIGPLGGSPSQKMGWKKQEKKKKKITYLQHSGPLSQENDEEEEISSGGDCLGSDSIIVSMYLL